MKTFIYIVVALLPIASFSQAVNVSCFGDCDGSVQAQPFGGIPPYTYLWSPTGQTTQIATGLCSGIHEVTFWDSTGQLLNVLGYFVAEPPQLVVTTIPDTNVMFGDSLSINSPTITGGSPSYSISWSPSLVNCSLGNCAIADSIPTTYVVTITDSNGCTAVDSFEILGMLPTGVLIIEDESIKVFPNPVSDQLVVENVLGELQIENIQLINLVGKQKEVYFNPISLNRAEINTTGLNPGIYFLIILYEGEKRSYQIIKH